MGFGSIKEWSVSLIIDSIGAGLSEAGDNRCKENSFVSVESGNVRWQLRVSCIVSRSRIRPTWLELFQAQKTDAFIADWMGADHPLSYALFTQKQ